MGVSTSHQITRYYDYFRDKEIIFTKANLQALKIDPRQIYIKCSGGQWPCIINSTSLQAAKIIIGTASGAFALIAKKKDLSVSLRFCFMDPNGDPVHFFVTCTIGDISKYQGSDELAIVTLNFTQRPPDDLIILIGEFVEVNENYFKRKEERISIDQNSIRKLGLEKEETVISIDNVPRRCILKDLSFGGARVMLVGIPKFLQEKKASLKIVFIDSGETVSISGIIKMADFLPGRKDIAVVHITFDDDYVPLPYKVHINNFITTYKKQILGNNQINAQNVLQQQEVENNVVSKNVSAVNDKATNAKPEEVKKEEKTAE